MKISTLIWITCLGLATAAQAHNGEDHGAPPAVVSSDSATARFVAASPDFEAVGEWRNGHLTLWLDRYTSNAPVRDGRVEIEANGFKGAAAMQADGTYVAAMPALAPGRYPLVLSVQAGEIGDLLTADLVIPERTTTGISGFTGKGLAAGALVLLVLGGVAGWRRRAGGLRFSMPRFGGAA